MKKSFLIASLLVCTFISGYAQNNKWLQDDISFAKKQIGKEINLIESSGTFKNPVKLNKNKSTYYCNYEDWRSGFFPGSIWLLYDLTGDKYYLPLAEKYSTAIEEAKNITWNHDVGFMIGCSFGNGYRLTKNAEYKRIIIQAAKSLSTRFRPQAGIIQSWDARNGWQCPVIIDNMMNLELMFEATRLSGDSTFYKIAVSHANRTLKEHFRPNGSCFHVVNYDTTTGKVLGRHTAQGYSDNSSWARGQAWAIYGYTMCYRETKDKRYLNQAIKTFNFMRHHKRMPKDCIPYWDMDAPSIPDAPRDASAAAVIASGLYQMYLLHIKKAKTYKLYADKIMQSLSSPEYRAQLGHNGNFLLMHSTGNLPGNSEIDVPLNYADYYFLEALRFKKQIEETK